ncbi:sorting nexin-14-like [Chelonus insularis]|uniref:sorting nexin-14-like n=1 Tax=Chelonus insularis TaxID=460826 RepID=UPI00158CEDE4|nr:sorting nexin-14-like [Chelonus insularis]
MITPDYFIIIFLSTIAVILVVFESYICSFFICGLYIVGRFWTDELISFVRTFLIRNKQQYINKLINNEACKVCRGDDCNRHRPSIYNTQVKIPKDLDAALHNLLENVLQTYVTSWYANVSADDAFLHQLRLATTIAIRNLTARLLRVKISQLIFDNLIPIALQHAQDWQVLAEQATKKGGNPDDFAVDYLGHRIHPAAYSREEEMSYLRGLVTGVLPHLLPSTYISTNNKVLLREILANWVLLPAMDALADPDNINFLIKLGTQCEGFLSQDMDSVNVPILQAWVTPVVTIQPFNDPLKPSLEQVLNDPQLLYLFMQHIKETGPVNLLQFCLDIDDLSKRMLNPEMTKEMEENLFIDAQNIYSTYLDPEGSEYVYLPWHISQGMQQILKGGSSKIQELRTSRPLYEAHQEAHALLETICLPSFHHSYELYKLLCGSPVSSNFTKTSTQSGMSGGAGMGTRLSNQLGKIRGALRATPVDGATFETPDVFQAEEVDCTPRTYQDMNFSSDKCNRDLTAWRVTVPHVDGGGSYPLYMVAIHSVAENKSWTILRRDQDFYTLRARLMEFHGDREMNDSPLPIRKNQYVSIAANRQRYEEFLQKLLVKPTLRSSELLHTFLTVPDLKPCLTSYSTPDIGVLYQSVAHKLRKEKGQHLDKFMNTFLASTNAENDQVNLGVDPINDNHFVESMKKGRDLISGPFNNNLNINPSLNLPYCAPKKQHVKGACFCIAEAVDSLLNVSPSLSTILWLTASLSSSNIDPICNKFLDDTLAKLLSGGRAAIVVKLLHNTIFNSKVSKRPPSPVVKDEERYKSAKEGLYSICPKWLIGIRTRYWTKMMDSLLDPLQNAPLNKHLAYMLVDQLIVSLFPELSNGN